MPAKNAEMHKREVGDGMIIFRMGPKLFFPSRVLKMRENTCRVERAHTSAPETPVTPDEREQMHILCERIAKEQDPRKFSELVIQLNNLLDIKAQRLQRRSTKPAKRPA